MNELAIGIDLGTSNSCVAVLRGSAVEVLPNGYGEFTTASVVAIKPNGSVVVGNAAKANIIHDPKHTVYSSKRLIGRYFFSEEVKKARAICSYEIAEADNHGVRIRIREELFSLPEIGAMVLRELKQIAEMQLGRAVHKAVITVPANFNDNQRQATKDAGRIAGLEVLRIMNEPTAAALAYGFGKGLRQRVAIYDLGGGTFDISVLEIADDVFEVLSTCGDTFLGGDDFDDRVIDLLADEFMQKENVNLRNDPYALEKLKVAAEEAKKALSVETEAEIRIPDIYTAPGRPPCSIQRTLGEREFAQLVNDLILRTFKVCDEALQQANVIARDLDGVILVGGPTRLPMIREAVRHYFQQEPKTDVDPDQVVAMGAAIHAASLVSSDQEAFLLDVTPLSLRIGVAGAMAESVIERNTPVPIEQTRTFTTFQDDQESVQIRVYQGESRVADENELLGQFEFSGFRKARRGEVAIDVTFEINADGIVNVTARDQETGKQSSTSITLSSGLSENELKSIIEEARTDRVQTASSAAAMPALPPASAQPAAGERSSPEPAAPVRSSPQPVAGPRKTALPSPEPEITEPELEILESPFTPAPSPNGPPTDGFAPADLTVSSNEAPTDEHVVFEATTQRGSDLADDSLELLDDNDLAALTPEIDLVDTESEPADGDPATRGLFDAPGTDLSTLPRSGCAQEELGRVRTRPHRDQGAREDPRRARLLPADPRESGRDAEPAEGGVLRHLPRLPPRREPPPRERAAIGRREGREADHRGLLRAARSAASPGLRSPARGRRWRAHAARRGAGGGRSSVDRGTPGTHPRRAPVLQSRSHRPEAEGLPRRRAPSPHRAHLRARQRRLQRAARLHPQADALNPVWVNSARLALVNSARLRLAARFACASLRASLAARCARASPACQTRRSRPI